MKILPSLNKRKPADHFSELDFQKVNRIDELLNKFAYSCSHSLKGPIVTIQGLLGLLEMEHQSLLHIDYLDNMKYLAEKMKIRVHLWENYQFNPKYKFAEKLHGTKDHDSVIEYKETLLRQLVAGILDLHDVVDEFSCLIDSKLLACKHAQELSYLRLIGSKIIKIKNFMKAIRNFSENRSKAIHKGVINMHQLIDQVITEIKVESEIQHIDIKLIIQQPMALVNDMRRIKQVMKHLLRNAVNFHEPLRQHPYIEFSVKVSRDHLLMEVIDNGQGIYPECQSKIFDLFYRASESSNGCGLGLFLVKEITGRLQGELKFSSQVGIGSIFKIRIPNLLSENNNLFKPVKDSANTLPPVLKIA